MLKKHEIIHRILDAGIVAIVRTDNPKNAEKIASACLDGGIKILEVTFSVPGADEVIRSLRQQFSEEDLLFGAGTVLDSETARIAHLAGASFIISPSHNIETARLCNRYQIPYMPGCMSPKDIVEAMESGAEIIKLFPGSVFTPDIIQAIKGPLPQAQLMPTGGVTLENVQDWFRAGCVAVGVGGSMTRLDGDNYEAITLRSREFINRINSVRSR